MDLSNTSSSKLVLATVLALVNNIQISDEDIAREILEYFQENGGGSVGSGFVYDRNSIVASNWIIDHNLNKWPQVTLIDDEGNRMEADIFYNNLNQVTVVFAEPTSGKAVLI